MPDGLYICINELRLAWLITSWKYQQLLKYFNPNLMSYLFPKAAYASLFLVAINDSLVS